MPAQSQQQQKLFGLALSVKRGDTPRSEASKEILKIVDTMTEKEIEDFAGTDHEGLPKKVEQKIREMARQTIREQMIGEAKFNKGDMVRVVDNPKYVMDKKKFAGMSGYVKNTIGRDVQVTFPNGRTILVDPKDLEMNPNESVNEDATQLWSQTIDMLDKNLKKGYDPTKIKNVNSIAGTLQKLFKGLPQRNAMDMATSYNDYKAGQKDKKQTVKDWVRILKKYQIKESVNEASGEFVTFIEKDNGRKKLLRTSKSQRAANMFMRKHMDSILNKSGIRSIGSMSKDQWEKKEAQFAENIKKSDMKTVTKKEWDRTNKDYKGMIKGQPYMMWFDKKTQSTVYGPVNIKESINERKPSKIVFDNRKLSAAKKINARNWYMKTFPTDELGAEIDKRISLLDVYEKLSKGVDAYKIIGVYDSVVRERIFEKLSKVLGLDYDVIYNMWESVVNEAASRTAMEIGGLTGMNKDAIQKFVDSNESVVTEASSLQKIFRKIGWGGDDWSPEDYARQIKNLPDSTLKTWYDSAKKNKGIPNTPLAFQQKLTKIEMQKRGLLESVNETKDLVRLVKGRTFDLGRGNFPTGLVVYNRAETKNGDFKQLAHISHNNNKITYYDKKLPTQIKSYIETLAKNHKGR